MQFGMWDTLFNMVLFLFWFRIWNGPGNRSLQFNPYLARIAYASDRLIQFLRPVFFGTPPAAVSGIAILFLITFRAAAVPANAHWTLHMGFVDGMADPEQLSRNMMFSFLSFAAFLFYLWSLSLVYVRDVRSASFRHTTEALHGVCRPFTDLPQVLRPPALLLLGMLTAAAIRVATEGPGALFYGPTATATLMLYAVSSLAGWAYCLQILNLLVFLLIIGSWVSMFGMSPTLLFLCRDWMDMIFGPMRRFPVRLGMLDLTPIVFLALLTAVYLLVMFVLYQGHHAILAAA